jgi:probable rRNA maturation factor
MNATGAGIQVDIQIEVAASIPDEALDALLRQAIVTTADMAGQTVAGEMALVLIDDERMRELNRTYRDVDAATDVLSFAAMDDSDPHALVLPADAPVYLGDVLISWPRARAQAAERGHAVEAELCLLAIHGLLHLLGYDHAEPDDRLHMWSIQQAVLSRLGYGEVIPTDE